MNLSQLFDHYSYRARLQPALITLFPLALGVIAWTGPGKQWMTSIWSVAGTAGLTFLLANVVRNRGKQVEPVLWREWGGAPTTQLLRHRGPGNSVTRERWHRTIPKLTGYQLPTAEEEQADPHRADESYEAAVRNLIGQRRDPKKHPLVYKENVLYGFTRNLYAMRGIGIGFSVVGLAVSVFAIYSFRAQGREEVIPWVSAVLCAVLLGAWIFRINSAAVRVPAFAYATRLLESSDGVTRARSAKTTPPGSA